ncbi:hypothetical protein GF359_02685 [candidate division WOR-3 bacterium]|uniref:OmpH family outer membrane protein n=1 Tax=candidate division WOR-3 bacterium TaxID=2052148 RepID=A0A9D5K8G8_UNCW3|nr:hypothetical protein [candidate division WOR-3 bacterium]MBD3364100.1 hypothetical protein [candidate division WOR-3 bacterium]
MRYLRIIAGLTLVAALAGCGAKGFAEKTLGADEMVRHYTEFVELRESYLNQLTRYLNLDMLIAEMDDQYGDEIPKVKQPEYEQMLTDRRGALHMVNDAARRYNQKAHDLTNTFTKEVVEAIFTKQEQVLPDSLFFVTAEVDSLWRMGLQAEAILP